MFKQWLKRILYNKLLALIKENKQMHEFTDLIYRCTSVSLDSLNKQNEEIIKELETTSSTSLIKYLQMISLHKTVLAVGMFSIFEAHLQDNLNCKDGFIEAKEILRKANEDTINENFKDLIQAINVLKHGKGRSYDALLERVDQLQFRIKLPDESFFEEGDLSEISTLIEVDDAFVKLCSKSISDVSAIIRQTHPDFI